MTLFQKVLNNYRLKGKITITPISGRPDKLMDDMPRGSNHYKFSVSIGRKRFSGYYSAGPGIKHAPDADDIFASLISDAGTYSSTGDIGSFANEFGYEMYEPEIRRKATRIFKAVEKTHKFLSSVFSESGMREIWELYAESGKL